MLVTTCFADGGEPERDVAYDTRHERNLLDFWPALTRGEPGPVFVWFHGGGFRDGDKSQLEKNRSSMLETYPKAGFAVVSCNYPFLSDNIDHFEIANHCALMTTKHLFTVASLCLLASASTFAQDVAFSSGSDPSGGGRKVAPAKSSTTNAPATSKARTRVADRRSSSDVEERLHASLSDETTQAFQDIPLDEALHAISQSHGIPIVLDRRAMEELGLAPDTPVSLSLKDVTLRVFLRLMLRELDLTYMIKDEVIQITTVEVAEQNLMNSRISRSRHDRSNWLSFATFQWTPDRRLQFFIIVHAKD